MASVLYGDASPARYVQALQYLRDDLQARGVTIHPLEAEPMGVVNAVMGRLTLMQRCWEEMERLADYLRTEYPTQMQAMPREATTAERVMHLLRAYRDVLRVLEVSREWPR